MLASQSQPPGAKDETPLNIWLNILVSLHGLRKALDVLLVLITHALKSLKGVTWLFLLHYNLCTHCYLLALYCVMFMMNFSWGSEFYSNVSNVKCCFFKVDKTRNTNNIWDLKWSTFLSNLHAAAAWNKKTNHCLWSWAKNKIWLKLKIEILCQIKNANCKVTNGAKHFTAHKSMCYWFIIINKSTRKRLFSSDSNRWHFWD